MWWKLLQNLVVMKFGRQKKQYVMIAYDYYQFTGATNWQGLSSKETERKEEIHVILVLCFQSCLLNILSQDSIKAQLEISQMCNFFE